jgi:3-oxoadipate enol-lactonase
MERKLRIGETEINFYDSDPEGERRRAVLLIHGLGGCWQLWRYQLDYLEELGLRVIAVDLRGHGGSTKDPVPYTVEMLAQDVAGLMEELELEPCAVVGHSLGGMVANQLAATRQELVSRLVIINSFSRIPKMNLKALGKVIQRFFIIYVLGMEAWARVLSRQLLPRADQAQQRDELCEISNVNDNRPVYINALRAVLKVDLRPRLGAITCPVKILAADTDYNETAAKLEDAALINANRDPERDDLAAVVEIKDSRHLSPWDQPEQVNRELRSFLDS